MTYCLCYQLCSSMRHSSFLLSQSQWKQQMCSASCRAVASVLGLMHRGLGCHGAGSVLQPG